jgi:hypothetical protein
MEYSTRLDAEMIGANSPAILEKLDMAASLGLLGEGLAYCVECSEGLAIVRLTGKGAAQCVAIAPAGAMPEGPIAERELFGGAWRAEWRTKRSLWSRVPTDVEGYRLGGFVACLMGGRSVALGMVTGLSEGGELERLLLMPGGAEIAPSDVGARRFWPFHRWPEGALLLWQRQGGRIIHNYQLACIQASNLERKAKGLPATGGRKKRKK